MNINWTSLRNKHTRWKRGRFHAIEKQQFWGLRSRNRSAIPARQRHLPLQTLQPYSGNVRTHSPKQIKQIARSIERFGFNNPVLIDDNGQIIAGHGRVQAAQQLALETVPCVRLSHLSEADKRAYVLADNRLAEKATGITKLSRSS
jgi:ParB-like chromosome segregation protein Spo0J